MGPVPAFSIERYADRYGYDEDELLDLRHCVRAMDQAFLRHVNNRLDPEPRPEATTVDTVMETAMTPELFKKLFGKGKTKRR